MTENKKLISLVGPTGAGKSRLAMGLSRAVGTGEILSCDSVQVYRGFDIGSAKPSLLEQQAVPHHLIDICDWDDPFDAEQFRQRAREALDDCRARGRMPVLCGGTGLYLRLLRWGIADTPGADQKLRLELEQREAASPGYLVQTLVEADPVVDQVVDLKNPRRVIRALEIFHLTGLTPSQIRSEHGFRQEEVPMEVVLLDWDSVVLRNRIGERLREMLRAGWVSEVEGLRSSGVSEDCPGMSAVGYREIVSHLGGEISSADLFGRIEKSTWGYVRRQRTWMRKEKGVLRVGINSEEDFLEKSQRLCEGVVKGEAVAEIISGFA